MRARPLEALPARLSGAQLDPALSFISKKHTGDTVTKNIYAIPYFGRTSVTFSHVYIFSMIWIERVHLILQAQYFVRDIHSALCKESGSPPIDDRSYRSWHVNFSVFLAAGSAFCSVYLSTPWRTKLTRKLDIAFFVHDRASNNRWIHFVVL